MTGRWFGPVEVDHSGRGDGGGGGDGDGDGDGGRAIIEVVFLAVLVLIPVTYILISVFRLQGATFAVGQAARDAGRAIDSAPSIEVGIDRAKAIIAIDLADQNVPAGQVDLRFVAAGSSCDSPQITPTLDGGAVYDVCVVAVAKLPGVPTVLSGSSNTVTGVYTVHIGDLREGG